MLGLKSVRAAADTAGRAAVAVGGLGVATVGVAGGAGIGLGLGCRDLVADALPALVDAPARLLEKVEPGRGDRATVDTAALTLGGDLVALAGSGLARVMGFGRAPRTLPAAVSLLTEQRWLRAPIDDVLGQVRTDLILSLLGAASRAANGDTAALAVDAAQHGAVLAEQLARRRAETLWELRPTELGISDSDSATDSDSDAPAPGPPRPAPLPEGPIERLERDAAAGALLGGGAFLAGRRGLEGSAEAVLAAVPRAARASRECFAAMLAVRMSGPEVLVRDAAAWRLLDRLTAVVVGASALRADRSLVLEARARRSDWTDERLWSAVQRHLSRPGGALSRADEQDDEQDDDGSASGLHVGPPSGPGPAGTTVGGPRWRAVGDRHGPIGRVLVGSELHPAADAMLAAARRAGLTVVLPDDADLFELRSRADELTAADRLADTVRRLQDERGDVVGVIVDDDAGALHAADLGIGVLQDAGPHPAGPLLADADVLCASPAPVVTLLAAVAQARTASRRGRTLALSGSTLSALLLVAGPRPGARSRALSPVTLAGMFGLVTGCGLGWAAGRAQAVPRVALLPWHALDPADVLARVTPPPADDTRDQAAAPSLPSRLATGITASRPAAFLGYVRAELADPLTPVLSVGAAASAILGSPVDAALVSSVMGANALVSALQRRRADRALTDLLAERRLVGRRLGPTGTPTPVPAERLRPGDLIALRAGDVVPADARLLDTSGLEVDESGLTGEPTTVEKQTAATPGSPLPERSCMVFEGSAVVSGSGRAVVVAVGDDTQAGRALAAVTPPSRGGVQAQLRSLTDLVLPATLAGGLAVSLLGLARLRPLRAAVADGVAVAVAAVPEGLPLVATVAQLAAARRLSSRGILVRSSRTIEALGRLDTICFDKTGTLTEGRLRLVRLASLDAEWPIRSVHHSSSGRRLLRTAVRACPPPNGAPPLHATDRAVLDAAKRQLASGRPRVWHPMHEVPFESNRGYAATLGRTSRTLRLSVKGAPEVLLPRCQRIRLAGDAEPRPMTPEDSAAAAAVIDRLARRGLRVLVVASRDLPQRPDDVEGAVDELTLVGFLGFADVVRPSTVPVVRQLDANGIGVRIITGDHPVTARTVASQLGMSDALIATGADLDRLDDAGRRALVERTDVFARVSPEHKVRIVAALQAAGHVVAMAGDGSNDAAAIRLADVGVGVEGVASTAARNAADLVLTRPDLTLLLAALVEGRAMWHRVRDAVAVLVGGNAGEVGFTVLGTGLTGRAPVSTRQFLLVNLLTDMFPAMAVALSEPGRAAAPNGRSSAADRAGADLAAMPPPDLHRELRRSILVRGGATAAGATAAWLLGRFTGTPRRASTMGLVALVGTQLGQTLVVSPRSPLVWATVLGSGAALIGIVQTPVVSAFFGCTPLDPVTLLWAAGCASTATALSVLLPRLGALVPETAGETAGEFAREAVALLTRPRVSPPGVSSPRVSPPRAPRRSRPATGADDRAPARGPRPGSPQPATR